MKFKYVYGPVPSRRLGRSLGVNPIPSKTCNYACIYCQLGRTNHMTNERKDFFPPSAILEEVKKVLSLTKEIDYITFVGEGEPTLCKSIGYLIGKIKELTNIPISVITNGALLYQPDVRKDLLLADVVMPSLDAADEETFKKINRPFGKISINAVIKGLLTFKKEFKGKLWIEVMLVKDVNDSEEHLQRLSNILREVDPDRVYINIPIRPPAEAWVEAPSPETITKAHAIIGQGLTIAHPEEGEFNIPEDISPIDAIIQIIRRHPMKQKQIEETVLKHFKIDTNRFMKELEEHEGVIKKSFKGTTFYFCK